MIEFEVDMVYGSSDLDAVVLHDEMRFKPDIRFVPERTLCTMQPTFSRPTMLEDMQEWTCSECGWFSYTQADGKDADAPRFCQNCGSEVL